MTITVTIKTTHESTYDLGGLKTVQISDRPLQISMASFLVTTTTDAEGAPVTETLCQVFGQRLTKTGKPDARSGAGGWYDVPVEDVVAMFVQINAEVEGPAE